MKRTTIFLLLLLLSTSVFAQKQVLKSVNAVKAYTKSQAVSAFNRATTLEPLDNTFTANNTAVQFVADAAVLRQIERAKPSLLEFSLPISATNTMVLELIPMDIFGDKFKVLDAQNQAVNVEKGVFYKGVVKGDNNSVVSLSLSNGELSGIVSNDNGNFILGKIKNASNYVFYNDHELLEKSKFDCGVEETIEHVVNTQGPVYPQTESLVCSPRPVQIYFEAANSIFTAQGANMTTATNFVNALFAQVAVLYANESITIQMSQLKIWNTADPYVSATDSRAALNLFIAQVGTGYTGDLAHLISARNLGGGVANGFEGLCNKGAAVSGNITSTVVNVPAYSWNVMVVTHELGHNFGSRHTHSCTWPGGAIDNCSSTEEGCARGPAPVNGGTIMSYCHQVQGVGINLANGFGPLPGNKIRSQVNYCIYTNKLDVVLVSPPTNTMGTCNGFQIVVTATGGTGAKTFSISPNIGSQAVSGTFTGLRPNTYVITTTDANGCTGTETITISEAFAFTTVAEIVNCAGTTGKIVATPTNNTNAFNYAISPNVGTQSPSGTFNSLPVGTYTITSTYAADATCPVTRTATVVARPAFGIDAPSVSKANSGVADGRILISGISGSKPYTFALSPNAGTQPSAGAFTGLAAGTYAVTVTDANGCTASTSNIVVGTLHTLTITTSSTTLCGSAPVNLNSLINTSGGTSVVWSKKPQAVQGTSGGYHHFVLLSDGTLTGWGQNDNGQLTFPTSFAAPIKQIVANRNQSLALLTNGSVVGWGDNSKGQLNIPTFAAPPIKLSAGSDNSLALLLDGSLVGWGNNSQGQMNFPAFPSLVKDLASGSQNNGALSVDGTLKVWGAPAPISYHSPMNSTPTFTAPVSAVSIGLYHALSLTSNGQVQGWGGGNPYGEITIPTFAAPVKQVLATWNTSYILLTNGATVVLGDGAGTHIPPTTTSTPLSISGIFTTVLTLYTDGSARSWGRSLVGGVDISTYDSEPLSNATVTPPVGTTTYYVVVRNAEGDYKTGEVTINVTAAPTAPVVASTAVCANESTAFTINSPSNTVKWFDATGTNVLQVGATFTTPNLLTTTAYKVRVESIEGCPSLFDDFTVTVNPKPATPVITRSNGANCGTVNLTVNTPNNNALNFVKASSQYVTVPHSSSLNLSTAFTMEAWVNYSGINSTIVDKGNYDFLWQLGANGRANKLGFYVLSTGTWIYSVGNVPENTWTHVAVTLNAGTLTFYINGVASGTAPGITTSQDNQPLNIGRQQPTFCACNHFNGSMDELRLWNVARTQAEIQASKDNSILPNSAGLVAYYKFDEGTGSTTADASGNGNNGTFVNNPTWQVPATSPVNMVVWSPSGLNNRTIEAIASGTYTATRTNEYGCVNAASTDVTITGLSTMVGFINVPYTNYNVNNTGGMLTVLSSAGSVGGTSAVQGLVVNRQDINAVDVRTDVQQAFSTIPTANLFKAKRGVPFTITVCLNLLHTAGGSQYTSLPYNNGILSHPTLLGGKGRLSGAAVYDASVNLTNSNLTWDNVRRTYTYTTTVSLDIADDNSFLVFKIPQFNNLTGVTHHNTLILPFVVECETPDFTWTGTKSTDWADAANWSCNAVPTATSDVTIPISAFYAATLTSSVTVKSLTFAGSNKLFLGNHNLTVSSITGNANGYVVTNGTGGLTIKDVFDFAKTFPVGSSTTSYTPVIIKNNVSRDFTVRVGTTITNAAALPKTVNLQWDVTPSVLTGNVATLAFGWNTANHGASFNPNTPIEVAHYNSTLSRWDKFYLATLTGPNPYVATVTGVNTFSPFAVANQNALPIELLDFKGTPQYNGNFLTWETTNEVNNKGFNVERLMDNGQWTMDNKWTTLGFVKSNGAAGTYQFLDNQPFTTSYYRLRQMDNDGKETLSKVISIVAAAVETRHALSLHPNPAHNNLTIDYAAVDTHGHAYPQYTVVNMLGQILLQGKLTSNNLDISTLPTGAFVLKIGEEQAKFFKQ
jgi:hypothetical protein